MTAVFVAIFMGSAVAMVLSVLSLGENGRATRERAHERRLADARMNARLLRFNL